MSLSRSDAKTDENGRTLSLGTDFFLIYNVNTFPFYFLRRALLFLAKYFLLFKLCIPFPLLQKPHHHQTFQVAKKWWVSWTEAFIFRYFFGGDSWKLPNISRIHTAPSCMEELIWASCCNVEDESMVQYVKMDEKKSTWAKPRSNIRRSRLPRVSKRLGKARNSFRQPMFCGCFFWRISKAKEWPAVQERCKWKLPRRIVDHNGRFK